VIRPLATAVLALLLLELTSCAGTTTTGTVAVSAGNPYWGGPVVGYNVGFFYGPPVMWGGWGPTYFVGPPPPRWGAGPPRPPPRRVGPSPVFRPAPPGRPAPSIPSGPRGGGTRGAPARR
jgi:hypothetical protein